MPRFTVIQANVATFPYSVDADTPEEAERIAAGNTPRGLCHECSRSHNMGDWELHSVEDEDGNVVRTGSYYLGDDPE